MRKTRNNVNKRCHILLILCILIVFTPIRAYASESEEVCEREGERNVNEEGRDGGYVKDGAHGCAGAEAAVEDFFSILPDGIKAEGMNESLGFKSLLEGVILALKGEGAGIFSFALSLLGVALITSLSSQLQGELGSAAARGVSVVGAALIAGSLYPLFAGAVEDLAQINSFFASVIPIVSAINSLGVSPTSAATQAMGMGVTLGVYSFLTTKALGVLVTLILVLSAASSADGIFATLADRVKKVFLTFMGVLTALIGATFSLQSAISASADGAVLRGAKYAVSASVPIVGNTVSGALALVSGSVGYAKGIVGVGAVAVILTLLLSPLAVLFAYRIVLSFASFLVEVSSPCDGGVRLSPIASALECVIALYALTAVVYVVELTAFLKGGVGGA